MSESPEQPTSHSALTPDDPPVGGMVVDEAEAALGSAGTIQAGKLAGRSMWSAIGILALPILVQQLMAALLGLFDKIFAGGLPQDIVVPALDGLGIAAYIGWFIGIAMTGLGIGGQAIIARAMGGGRIKEGEQALGQAFMLSAIWGALVGVALWWFAPSLARITELTPEAAGYCVTYIRTLSCAMPFCGIMMVGAMCLHGAGETAKPSIIMVLVNVVNIFFSWMLSGAVMRFGERELANPFSFDLQVLGIALGTALSYLVGAVLITVVLRRGVKDLKLHPRLMKPDGPLIRRIFHIGLPNFLEGISMWAVNIFILKFIGQIATKTGEEGLQGAHIIAVQWEAFSFLPGFAIGTAAGALAGQYLGAGNPQMAQKAILACTGIGVVVMGLLGVVYMTQGAMLTSIISGEAVHMEHTPNLLFICGTMQVFFAVLMIMRQGLRGVGDTRWTLFITTLSSYGVRLPASYYLGVHLGWGIEGIWYGLCGEFGVRAILFSSRFFHGGWKRIRV